MTTTVGENRLRDQLKECLCERQGAGTTVLCQSAFRFSQFYLHKVVFIYPVRSPCFILTTNLVPEYKVSTLYSGTGTMLEFGCVHISVHRVPYSAILPGNKGTRGGDSAYESGGDARRLSQGCKFRILVSFRVFWANRHHIQPWRSRLGLHAKKYKNLYLICVFLNRFIYSIHVIQVFSFVCVLTRSLSEIKKSLGHARIGLLQGFNSKFPTSIPTSFICGVPPRAKEEQETCYYGLLEMIERNSSFSSAQTTSKVHPPVKQRTAVAFIFSTGELATTTCPRLLLVPSRQL